jgi:hypothetical protein
MSQPNENIRIIYPQYCEWIEFMKGYLVGKFRKCSKIKLRLLNR